MSNYKVTCSEQMYRLRLFLNTHTAMEHDSICKWSETKWIKLLKIRECGGVHLEGSWKNKQRRKEINRERTSTRRNSQRIQRLYYKKKEKGNTEEERGTQKKSEIKENNIL